MPFTARSRVALKLWRQENSVWPKKRFDRLLSYRDQRMTFAEIATCMGTTRGAIAGIMWRLGEKSLNQPNRRKVAESCSELQKEGEAMPKRKKEPEPIPAPLSAAPAVHQMLGRRFMDLAANSCRWPLEERDEHGIWTFCKGQRYDGASYCAAHCRLAYSMPVRRV